MHVFVFYLGLAVVRLHKCSEKEMGKTTCYKFSLQAVKTWNILVCGNLEREHTRVPSLID